MWRRSAEAGGREHLTKYGVLRCEERDHPRRDHAPEGGANPRAQPGRLQVVAHHDREDGDAGDERRQHEEVRRVARDHRHVWVVEDQQNVLAVRLRTRRLRPDEVEGPRAEQAEGELQERARERGGPHHLPDGDRRLLLVHPRRHRHDERVRESRRRTPRRRSARRTPASATASSPSIANWPTNSVVKSPRQTNDSELNPYVLLEVEEAERRSSREEQGGRHLRQCAEAARHAPRRRPQLSPLAVAERGDERRRPDVATQRAVPPARREGGGERRRGWRRRVRRWRGGGASVRTRRRGRESRRTAARTRPSPRCSSARSEPLKKTCDTCCHPAPQ